MHRSSTRRRCGLLPTIVMAMLLLLAGIVVVSSSGAAAASLATPSPLAANFYEGTCPSLEPVVMASVSAAVRKEARMAASVLRLFFHDCFVQGCDGSVLLDDIAPGFIGEKTAFPNDGSLRGFDVIDDIKLAVEAACPGVVSCADILALAARDAVALSGGPYWRVLLGRRDSTTASYSAANANLPSPNADLATLIAKFQSQGLSVDDMVTLSGAHTIGQSRCTSFRSRLYDFDGTGTSDSSIDASYLSILKGICPASGGDDSTFFLDSATPTRFDNRYFGNLLRGRGLLASDQELFFSSSSSSSLSAANATASLVQLYSRSTTAFFASFCRSMIAMGNLNPLTGTSGQVRADCRLVNR